MNAGGGDCDEFGSAYSLAPMNTDIPHPPWLHLLEPQWLAWREWQYIKGNNPDPCLEQRLKKMGLWPHQDRGQTSRKN